MLNTEINAAVADTAIKARLTDLGGTPLPGSSTDFGTLIAEQTERWGQCDPHRADQAPVTSKGPRLRRTRTALFQSSESSLYAGPKPRLAEVTSDLSPFDTKHGVISLKHLGDHQNAGNCQSRSD